MAPHREESWDNDLSHGLISNDNASDCARVLNECALKTTVFVASPSTTNRPKSILYQPTIGVAKRTNTMPSHWPLTFSPSLDEGRHHSEPEEEPCREESRGNYSVSFASDVVASTRDRPRTHVLDIPTLYYSATDIKRFKREYRNLVRVQSLARERMERNSSENVASRTDLQPHDNSFWRSKVGRRWSVPPRDAATETSTAGKQSHSDYSLDPLNDGSSCVEDSTSSSFKDENEVVEPSSSDASSYGGMFSSVFDVARDTLSALNGSHYTSRTSPPCKAALRDNYSNKPCKATSLHLVDTLYLF